MRSPRWQLALLMVGGLVGCGGAAEDQACDDLCTELMQECGFTAFPDRDSCLQGCAYDAEQGADTTNLLGCVTDASCDLAQIVECEHSHGITAGEDGGG
jgi:hypothetical protein